MAPRHRSFQAAPSASEAPQAAATTTILVAGHYSMHTRPAPSRSDRADEMPALPSDHNHLRSGMLMDVVPPGKGNTPEGRLLRQHARMLTDHLERLSIEVTELHRLLIVRLGRMALQIARLEQRLDEGRLPDSELRQYHYLSNHYLAVLRELTLRPPRLKSNQELAAEPAEPAAGPVRALADILAEMPE